MLCLDDSKKIDAIFNIDDNPEIAFLMGRFRQYAHFICAEDRKLYVDELKNLKMINIKPVD
jgi:hypothetical protein